MSFVLVDRPKPEIAVVTLNRPDRMNAMAFDVMVPLRETLEAISVDNTTRVVILTGSGGAFCAGADLKDPGYVSDFDGLTMPGIARRAMKILGDVIDAIQAMHQPVIAAINGAAIGGGFCLSLAADIRFASPTAHFRAAGINNGLTAAELGISYILPKVVGAGRAFEIMLTGRDVSAEEAERIGLLSGVIPQETLMEHALQCADNILRFSHMGTELTKKLLWTGLESNQQTQKAFEDVAQLYVRMTTSNFEEAVKSRRENREPVFTDDK